MSVSLRHAQAWSICRICEKPMSAPFRLDYGKEFAHESCLDSPQQDEDKPESPPGWKKEPTYDFWHWMRRGPSLLIVFAKRDWEMPEAKRSWLLYQCSEPDYTVRDTVREGDLFKVIERPG